MTDFFRLAVDICHPERELVSGPSRREERPEPQWLRGQCPLCGGDVVSNAYHVGGRGYLIFLECWEGLGEAPTCDYRKGIL